MSSSSSSSSSSSLRPRAAPSPTQEGVSMEVSDFVATDPKQDETGRQIATATVKEPLNQDNDNHQGGTVVASTRPPIKFKLCPSKIDKKKQLWVGGSVVALVVLLIVLLTRGSENDSSLDPPIEVAILSAENASRRAWFGRSVAIWGDTLVAGAPWDNHDGERENGGSVFVYTKPNVLTNWTYQAHLIADDANEFDEFGWSVAISENLVAVGAYRDDNGGLVDQGSVYLFERSSSTAWIQQAKLTAPNASAYDWFGYSVALQANTLVVGAARQFGDEGCVYVFERINATTWNQQAKLMPGNAVGNMYFGESLALDGDTIVVGAPGASTPGRAYVFVRTIVSDSASWVQQAMLVSNDASNGDQFGRAVTIFGDTIVVGADRNTGSEGDLFGSAHVFERSGMAWTNQAKLIADDASGFGHSVAIEKDTIVVGSIIYNSYLFRRNDEGTWNFWAKLPREGQYLAVAIHNDTVVVGAQDRGGRVYVFEQDPDDNFLFPE